VAGAVLLGPAALAAQVVPKPDTIPRRDSIQRRDTIPKRLDSTTIVFPGKRDTLADTLAAKKDTAKKVPKDTIKAPLAQAELPADIGIAKRLHWRRDSLYATGAITVADLLQRVLGSETLSAGWISAPALTSYMGQVRHVRVFYDGVELGSLDPRAHGDLDLTEINLWSIEEADVEQAPEEIRVYLRSWRVNNTTPVTRTDIATGDQQTNLYRGFFGKRMENGLAFQFGAQQYGTTPPSDLGSSSDQLGVIARVGWARKNWSVDAYSTHIHRHRGTIFGFALGDSLEGIESSRTYSYLRGAYGSPDTSHYWGQLMAVASSFGYTGIRTVPTTNLTTAAESALAVTPLDTNSYQTQYIAAAGVSVGALRASLTQRLFLAGGHYIASASWRASYSWRQLDVSAFTQGMSADSIKESDITARFTPLSFVALLAGAGKSSEFHNRDSSFAANYVRVEAGLRVHNLWLLGGVIRRDSTTLDAPVIFDTLFVPRAEPAVNGVTAEIRGQLWRLIHTDVSAVRWSDTLGLYRSRYETRSELFVQTGLLEHFPRNDFNIKASVVHEYHSGMHFPVGTSDVISETGYRTLSTLLEIRILSATLTWQFRNILGERYTEVPTFVMPRQTNFYGVRWEFVD
jgi:hypothetical protein